MMYLSTLKCLTIFLLLSLICCYTERWPTEINPPPKGVFLSDPDLLLSNQELHSLNEKIKKISKSLEIGVLIINKMASSFLSPFRSQDQGAHEFAKAVFDRWGIGSKETNNGLLIFISTLDRKFRIVTGKGARKIISDSNADAIFENVKPKLKSSNYAGAIDSALNDVEYYENPPNFLVAFFQTIYQILTALMIPLMLICIFGCIAFLNERRPINRKRKNFEENLAKLKELQQKGKLNEHFIQKSCGICLEEFEKDDTQNPKKAEFVILVCGHNFHKECLESWLKTKNLCPFCKIKDPTNPNRNDLRDDETEKLNSQDRTQQRYFLNNLVYIQRNRYPEFYNDYSFNYGSDSFTYTNLRQATNVNSGGSWSSSFSGGSSSGGGGGGGSW